MPDTSSKPKTALSSSRPVAATITTERGSAAYDATIQSEGSFPQAQPLAEGTVIGERYVIEQHVSSGGFGAVYRAADREIRSHVVALKLLHGPAADEQARERALHELTVLASLSHPSIVQFKDYGWHQGRLWFAMPWYRGTTLAQRYGGASASQRLTRALARPIFERTARGLAAMHELGISHCDLKPDNLFLADVAGFDEGLPVLIDLGIAATRGEGPRGMTVEYAAPETAAVALGARVQSVGPAADVFSLALVLRNLLQPETAQRVQGEALSFLHARATQPVAPPVGREFRHLQASFARWLHLDPALRPTAAQFASELALLTRPEEERAARTKLLRRVAPFVALVGLVVAVLVGQLRRGSRELRYEKTLLDQQVKTTEQLRAQSMQQLRLLEAESKSADDSDRGLRRATLNARQFKALLERSEQRAAALERKLRDLNAAYEDLKQHHDRAQVQPTAAEGQQTASTGTAPPAPEEPAQQPSLSN